MDTNYGPQGPQEPPWMQPPQQPQNEHPPSVPQKWYRMNGDIIALLSFFFPSGLYLMWKYTNRPKNAKWILMGILIFCVLIGGCTNAASSTQQTSQTSVPTQQPIVVTTKAPTPTLTIHYPPITVADLHDLAVQGSVSAIHEYQSESVGAVAACPQPKRVITVDPSVTGRQFAEDLLAYFYTQQIDSPCGSIVFAYHTPTEAETSDVYTAGRILFEVTDSSGAINLDPNASNLKYTLTLDIGGDPADSGGPANKEYVVTY